MFQGFGPDIVLFVFNYLFFYLFIYGLLWTTALFNSMKLWAMPCRAIQDGWVTVESCDKTWSTGEGSGKPLQYSCLGNPMNSMKRQKDRTLKGELPGSVGAHMLLETSGEITPERMKGRNQSKNNTQVWMWLMIEATTDAIKSNIAWEPRMLG